MKLRGTLFSTNKLTYLAFFVKKCYNNIVEDKDVKIC